MIQLKILVKSFPVRLRQKWDVLKDIKIPMTWIFFLETDHCLGRKIALWEESLSPFIKLKMKSTAKPAWLKISNCYQHQPSTWTPFKMLSS